MKIPNITSIIDLCCRLVKAKKGHDVDATEGRAFTRQFFIQLSKMDPDTRHSFVEKYVRYYEGKKR